MNDQAITTIKQVHSFLEGTESIGFSITSKKDRYTWIQRNLVKFSYLTLSKKDKGILIRYLCKVTDYSRQQMTRLIQQSRKKGRLVRRQSTTNGFQGIPLCQDSCRL